MGQDKPLGEGALSLKSMAGFTVVQSAYREADLPSQFSASIVVVFLKEES